MRWAGGVICAEVSPLRDVCLPVAWLCGPVVAVAVLRMHGYMHACFWAFAWCPVMIKGDQEDSVQSELYAGASDRTQPVPSAAVGLPDLVDLTTPRTSAKTSSVGDHLTATLGTSLPGPLAPASAGLPVAGLVSCTSPAGTPAMAPTPMPLDTAPETVPDVAEALGTRRAAAIARALGLTSPPEDGDDGSSGVLRQAGAAAVLSVAATCTVQERSHCGREAGEAVAGSEPLPEMLAAPIAAGGAEEFEGGCTRASLDVKRAAVSTGTAGGVEVQGAAEAVGAAGWQGEAASDACSTGERLGCGAVCVHQMLVEWQRVWLRHAGASHVPHSTNCCDKPG